jgi:hypothetical protein
MQIFLAFSAANTVAERLQVVADAGPALDALQAQLEAQRATAGPKSKGQRRQSHPSTRLRVLRLPA